MHTEISERSLHFRPIEPQDDTHLVAGLELLSEESRFGRFFYNKRSFGADELRKLTHCDGFRQSAVVAVIRGERTAPVVGVARWVRDAFTSSLADVAFVTRDDWQRRGVGASLIKLLASDAKAKGVTHFRAQILWGNPASIKLLNAVGSPESRESIGSGATEFVYRLR